ncbi:MAG: hypothetical protein A2381_04670 [Bdellovibrionales bacterium RIFOXYB1_FULL_37_110]|nr:MAG: hypothetical protein A2181_01100 [Bdellovibrionales bacterium RIFOXYA1_FULL_38_20]OFZ50479.1 MAG: hypothetical protein A2417_10650 [Bdellovibrionales bacterium RIFOXYC1_FULL_37_79]OFZ56685.1 MAG: hypothetical protein A2328_09410 [Bdellovibrionales bacterium RIFOXYB2_FULL_36_6]OFZ60750.1 MAG: hypothetical protein A2381_04670 [Bdellovibrionales bacterium RIFOXYB1_FULL_37_110]OFZ64464.1 MAG: hypothetical protein A2577_08635 [Bdellovibrionales bacterium RIFOXYD1_FULL_36_51]
MSKIITIRHSESVDYYFTKLCDDFFDIAMEFVFIPGNQLDQLEKYFKLLNKIFLIEMFDEDFTQNIISNLKVNENEEIYLVFNSSTLNEEDLFATKKILIENPAVAGWIDTNFEVEFYVPFFRNLLKRQANGENVSHLKNVGKQLEGLVGNTLAELQRVKNIHEQVVPMRNEKMKGVEILSKYSAGEKTGGDFFDILSDKNEFVLLLTTSVSYVVSSVILAHFEVLKKKKNLDDQVILDLIGDIESELGELGFGKKVDDIQLFVVKFDLKKFIARGYIFGKFELISNMKGIVTGNDYPLKKVFADKAHVDIPFKRGEKLVLLSPGVRNNFAELVKENDLTCFLRDNFSQTGKALLNELFFNLHKNCKNDFLVYDASVIFIEVSKNAIFQV